MAKTAGRFPELSAVDSPLSRASLQEVKCFIRLQSRCAATALASALTIASLHSEKMVYHPASRIFHESSPQEEYWGLNLLANGAATLWSKHLHSPGSIVSLHLTLAAGSEADMECLVADCYCEEDEEYHLTLLLLGSEGLPSCKCHGYQSDLELSS